MVPDLNPAADPPLANFVNIGQNFKEGLPFTPWAADSLRKQRMATNSKENPDAQLPAARIHAAAYAGGAAQGGADRQRPRHPCTRPTAAFATSSRMDVRSRANDSQPWWYGYSVGKYEGDTLVVETIGLRDEGVAGCPGCPVHQWRQDPPRDSGGRSSGRMEIDVTIDDPRVYTSPWTVRVNWRLGADEELIEFICQENNLSITHMK